MNLPAERTGESSVLTDFQVCLSFSDVSLVIKKLRGVGVSGKETTGDRFFFSRSCLWAKNIFRKPLLTLECEKQRSEAPNSEGSQDLSACQSPSIFCFESQQVK